MLSTLARADVPAATGNAVSNGFTSTTSSSYVNVQSLNVQVDAVKSGLFDIASSMALSNASGSSGQTVAGGLAIDGILVQTQSIHLGAGDASAISIPWQVNLAPGNHTIALQFADPSGLGVSASSAHLQATGYALLPVFATGDYNHNGTVDAADYVVWRKTLNQSGINLPADGNANSQIDQGDFDVWRGHFGQMGSGSGATGNVAVPEPSILAMLLVGVLATYARRRTLVS